MAVTGSPSIEIGRARARRRVAVRQAVALAALAAVGLVLAVHGTAFGLLVAAFAFAVVVIEVVVVVSARERMSRAADDLIDAGVPVGLDDRTAAVVHDRLLELRSEWVRRRTARALRDAIVSASRRRSSNPLVLASHTVVMGRGTARALLSDHDLVLRVADACAAVDADPRAILVVRNLLYPRPDALVPPDEQEQLAHRELRRAAQLLGVAVEATADGEATRSTDPDSS